MSFSYKYGAFKELQDAYYIGYNLEALFYDAVKRIHYSRELIYHYYCSHVERGSNVPEPIQQFIASEIRKVIEKKQTPVQMFKPLGQKGKTTKAELSLVLDAVFYSRTAPREKGETVFTKASEMLKYYGTYIEADRVEQIYRELAKPRAKRIKKVSKILGQLHTVKPSEDRKKLISELQTIYKDTSKLA